MRIRLKSPLTNFTTHHTGTETPASAEKTLDDHNGDGNTNTEKRADNAQSDVSLRTRLPTTPEELDSSESVAIDPLSQVRRYSLTRHGILVELMLTLSPAYTNTDANGKINSLQVKIADFVCPGFERRRDQG